MKYKGRLDMAGPYIFAAQELLKSPAGKRIEWLLKPKKWESLGAVDLIPQVNPALQWTNQSLIKYGIAWRPGGCCMR
ncbi:MAG: hypothetical protein ACYS76_05670, partial [Planctomycetota bacterium]